MLFSDIMHLFADTLHQCFEKFPSDHAHDADSFEETCKFDNRTLCKVSN